jgi:hypothetical protein
MRPPPFYEMSLSVISSRRTYSGSIASSARIETLEAELAKLEATAAVRRADFERERCERVMAEVLKTTAELMAGDAAISEPVGARDSHA